LITNNQLLNKMRNDMKMRNFSHYTYDSYFGKTKDIMRYFGNKNLEKVTTNELRVFLLKYLKEERKLGDSTINYYNVSLKWVKLDLVKIRV